MIGDQTRWVWVDVDGDQVSPIHTKFSAALNFIDGWEQRYERLSSTPYGYQFENMTKSGKPPVTLKRLVTTTKMHDLTDAQKSVLEEFRR